ncbi:MAG: DUF2188 domain-containing protein [Erysipelothrix sp.]|nr:DUF2188 domain-containing protein [Erysipelothrix sp.]
MGKNQHVQPHNDGWQVKGEGNTKATKLFETQAEAIKYARDIAINQKAEVIIHGRDGEVRETDSYENGPRVDK